MEASESSLGFSCKDSKDIWHADWSIQGSKH